MVAKLAGIMRPTPSGDPIRDLEARIARLELAVYILLAAQAPGLVSVASAMVG